MPEDVLTIFKHADHPSSHSILGTVNLILYECDGEQVVVLRYGNPTSGHDLPLRVQSACAYGDALAISDCDCRQQLEDTFGRFLESRKGILVYLRQEGHGAGLAVQADACQIAAEQAVDTVQAYRQLGVSPERQQYRLAVEVLRDLGTNSFALLTNNPRKVESLKAAGFDVVREPMPVRPTVDNLAYLEAKQHRLGEYLGLRIRNGDRADSPRCFVIGAAAMDHVLEVRHNPSIGRARQASRYRRRPGGKGFNQAVALSRLGAAATLLTVRGTDPDAAEISNVLATERVHGLYTGTPDGLRTPQTVVIQPPGSSPTFVGWLGEEHRTLRRQTIGQHLAEIEASDAVLVTLEASEDAVHHTARLARANALVLLNASPVAEPPYEIGTETLEHVDVLVGSREELSALIPRRGRRRVPRTGDELEIVQALSRLCGITVVLIDFCSVRRWALAVNPHLSEAPVRVFGGDVRRIGVSDAIGTTDVFCAALALRMLELPSAAELPRKTGAWRAEDSPLARREYLADAVMLALGAEAYVSRSRGGYKTFPRQGPEFERWCRDHAPVLEPAEVTLRAFERGADHGPGAGDAYQGTSG